MVRITLPDGRWVELRPIRLRDMTVMDDLFIAKDGAVGAAMEAVLDRISQAIEDSSLENGDIQELTGEDMGLVLRQWRSGGGVDDAVPPAKGRPSAKPSRRSRSARKAESTSPSVSESTS